MNRRPNLIAGEDLLADPRQDRSTRKRAALKAAALKTFAAVGYERASIEEMTRSAGLAAGGFYQHFRSKRQLLLVLMNELLVRLDGVQLEPAGSDIRMALHALLTDAFAHDLEYLGAYRAWQEAVMSDAELDRMDRKIREWTRGRVSRVLTELHAMAGARRDTDVESLARTMDSFFWALLLEATRLPPRDLDASAAAAAHMVYHALFTD